MWFPERFWYPSLSFINDRKMKKAVDNKKVFGALYTEISKTFDCISHYYLIAKLYAYGLLFTALKLVQDNL